MRYFLYGFALVVALVTAIPSANATTYEYWVCSGNNGTGNTCTVPYGQAGTWFATGVEACQANDPRSAGYPGDIVAPYWNSAYPTLGICIYDPDPAGDPITWGLATHYTINCTDPQVIDLANHGCSDPPPPCPAGQTLDPGTGFCFTTPDCSAGSPWDGPVQTSGDIVGSTCTGGCSFSLDYFEFISSGTGIGHYLSTGSTCTDGSLPSPTPLVPEPSSPVPDPVTPEPMPDPVSDPAPAPYVPPDPQNPAPATDVGQGTISSQLDYQSGQLTVIGTNGAGAVQALNTTNQMLGRIQGVLEQQGDQASQDQGTACDPAVESCGDGTSPGDGPDWTDNAADIAAAKQAISDQFETMKAGMEARFSMVLPGGTCENPSMTLPYIGSTTIDLCAYLPSLSVLGVIMLALASWNAIQIVFGD